MCAPQRGSSSCSCKGKVQLCFPEAARSSIRLPASCCATGDRNKKHKAKSLGHCQLLHLPCVRIIEHVFDGLDSVANPTRSGNFTRELLSDSVVCFLSTSWTVMLVSIVPSRSTSLKSFGLANRKGFIVCSSGWHVRRMHTVGCASSWRGCSIAFSFSQKRIAYLHPILPATRPFPTCQKDAAIKCGSGMGHILQKLQGLNVRTADSHWNSPLEQAFAVMFRVVALRSKRARGHNQHYPHVRLGCSSSLERLGWTFAHTARACCRHMRTAQGVLRLLGDKSSNSAHSSPQTFPGLRYPLVAHLHVGACLPDLTDQHASQAPYWAATSSYHIPSGKATRNTSCCFCCCL